MFLVYIRDVVASRRISKPERARNFSQKTQFPNFNLTSCEKIMDITSTIARLSYSPSLYEYIPPVDNLPPWLDFAPDGLDVDSSGVRFPYTAFGHVVHTIVMCLFLISNYSSLSHVVSRGFQKPL